MHRRVYLAIRGRNVEQARSLMDDHLRQAAMHHAEEARQASGALPARSTASGRRRRGGG
jgi:hypothetical protein